MPAQARTDYRTWNGCSAELITHNSGGASHSENNKNGAAACSLATYHVYYLSGNYFTTSTDWDSYSAEKFGPSGSTIYSGTFYVNYTGPLSGKCYTFVA